MDIVTDRETEGKHITRRFMNFEKDSDSRWYAVIPEWDGCRSDLEMVLGADYMLELLAQGEDNVRVKISTVSEEGYKYELTFESEEYDGGWYNLKGLCGTEFPLWLCSVTKFVFNELPEKLYINN